MAPEDDPILDAARATVLDFGVRRMTVSEVARRAGVSRMTVYRRYPDGDALTRALMAREFGETLARAVRASEGAATVRARLVTEVVGGADLLMAHPVMRRLLEVDAEMLLPYFTEDVGRFQRLVHHRVAELVEEGQRTGDVRAGDPERLAATVELALRGVILAARTLDDEAERTAVLGELSELVDRYLRPA